MKRLGSVNLVVTSYLLAVLAIAGIIYFSFINVPPVIQLGYNKRMEVSEDGVVVRDDRYGYSVHLPPDTIPVQVSEQQIVLGRGVYTNPFYVLNIDTTALPTGVPRDEYLSLMYEAASIQAPDGYEFIYAQEFRQYGEPAIQRVYLATAEPPILEHQYIYARDGAAYMLRFFYKLEDQKTVEPEIEWFKDTFRIEPN